MTSIALAAMLIYVNAFVPVPKLSDRKKTALYITGLPVLVFFTTCLRNLSNQYWDNRVWPEDPMEISSYFRWALRIRIRFL